MSKNLNIYYGWPPINKKFYLPNIPKKMIKDSAIYQPYTLKAKILWLFYSMLKYIKKTNFDHIVNDLEIGSLINKDHLYIIYLGTAGPENKITMLQLENNNPTAVFKISKNRIAKDLSKNEISILEQLNSEFIPHLVSKHVSNEVVWFKTNYFQGKKIESNTLSNQLIDFIYEINSIEIDAQKYDLDGNSDKLIFSHGDFCPWNLHFNTGYVLIDWEKAGYYPIGFDLFTFIFAYEILVKNNKELSEIISRNELYIQSYFSKFNIDVFDVYLKYFFELKIRLEINNKNNFLTQHYQYLLEQMKNFH